MRSAEKICRSPGQRWRSHFKQRCARLNLLNVCIGAVNAAPVFAGIESTMHPFACTNMRLFKTQFNTRLLLILMGFFLYPGLLSGAEIETVRLSPLIHIDGSVITDLPEIPARVIEPFLARPLVIEPDALKSAPRVVATQESRINVGLGSSIYVAGLETANGPAGSSQDWQLFRPGKALIDPDTGQQLGVETLYLGTARLERRGEPATLRITSSTLEVGLGDRLVPMQRTGSVQHLLRTPQSQVNGRVIGLMAGLVTAEGGQYSIVSINRGLRNGVEQGHVLALYRAGDSLMDPETNLAEDKAPRFVLPEERYGLVYVFRSFEKLSYALILESSRQMKPGDLIKSP